MQIYYKTDTIAWLSFNCSLSRKYDITINAAKLNQKRKDKLLDIEVNILSVFLVAGDESGSERGFVNISS